jgi:hypothetical protein
MKRLALLFAVTVLTSSAATKITYDEIPTHVAPFGTVIEHRAFTVTTSDGKTRKGRRLELWADHLSISKGRSYEDLPRDTIKRIEIRQSGRFVHHIVENSSAWALACWFGCSDAVFLLVPPVWAYTAATAPFFLAADGIAFFIPPRVYEITH